MKHQICTDCKQPMIATGTSGNRLTYRCGCGEMVMNSSYDRIPALTLDPEGPDAPPKMREICGEDIIWGHWWIAEDE